MAFYVYYFLRQWYFSWCTLFLHWLELNDEVILPLIQELCFPIFFNLFTSLPLLLEDPLTLLKIFPWRSTWKDLCMIEFYRYQRNYRVPFKLIRYVKCWCFNNLESEQGNDKILHNAIGSQFFWRHQYHRRSFSILRLLHPL